MKIGEILKAAKVPLYFTSVAPVITAAVYAGMYNPIIFLILSVVIFMQAALNTSMDYYDFKFQRHLLNSDTLFPLGSYFIEKMNVKPETILKVSRILLAISTILGILVVIITRNIILLYFGLIAIFFALIYVIPPFRLGSRGIGEISTFVDFGIFPFIGSLIALGKNINFEDILIASSFGIFASMIRYLHHIAEDSDKSKRVRYFRMIYLILIFGVTLSLITINKLFFLDLLVTIILIYHWLRLPRDKFGISRKTNEIVSVQILYTIMLIFTILFK